jgi:hypothetical protein
MPDSHTLEDQAALYVSGGLTPAELCEFEASLAESAELRALVRDLEEGAGVLAMAVPQRRPPQHVWQRIEEAIAEESKRKIVAISFWSGWWRSGWAAAAACLMGWLLHALWINRSSFQDDSPSLVAQHDQSQPGMTLTDAARMDTGDLTPPVPGITNAGTRSLQMASTIAPTKEISALRGQIAQLQRQVGQLSQVLTQQQALLADSGRLKFFQLIPSSGNGVGATTIPPSPDLQRALLLALSRELGWRSAADRQSHSNQGEIDFVDLHPGANEPVNPGQSQLEPGRTETAGDATLVSASVTGIPAVVLGDRAYLAFDSSVVTNGTALTFFAGTSSLGFQTLGTAVLGSNRLVVTVPLGNATSDGLGITVNATTSSGLFNTFVPIPTPASRPP